MCDIVIPFDGQKYQIDASPSFEKHLNQCFHTFYAILYLNKFQNQKYLNRRLCIYTRKYQRKKNHGHGETNHLKLIVQGIG